MLFATLCEGGGGKEGFFSSFFWQDWKGRKGVMKRYVWRIEAKGEEASCVAMKRGEEMRAQQRGESLWKNAELKGLEEQNQHLCKHSEELAEHTHTHGRTHTDTHLYTAIQQGLL